jgi:protein O-mannosyl-transferase
MSSSRRPDRAATLPAAASDAPWPMRRLWPLLAVVTLLAYLPALQGGFIWDDNGHVTRPDLRSLAGLVRIWTEVGATQQYYPVLHTAFWIEHGLWGDAAVGYHLLNILLHATSAGLFVLVLRRLAIPGAAFAGLIFALHPVAVESVAWISEQKNTLSLVFYLLAAQAYLDFEEARDSPEPSRDRRKILGLPPYAAASILFLLALFSKSVTATLPAALLVVIWWRRGRLSWRRDVVPLLPWFAVGAGAGLFTSWVENRFIGAHGADFALSGLARCLLAGRVAWFYLGKLLWPAELIFIYPHWTVDPGAAWQYLFPLGLLVLLGVIAWRRQRGLLAGLLFFGGSLFPVLGFVNVYPFVYSYVADHFQYLACLGIIAPVAAGWETLGTRLSRPLARTAAFLLLCTLGILTWRQSRIYRDLFTLYQTTIDRNPTAWMAENNLGTALLDDGRAAEAIPHFEQALRLKSDFAEAENNLGDSLFRVGRVQEAIPHLQQAVKLQPIFAEAHNNLGRAFMAVGRQADGTAEFLRAVQLQPSNAVAQNNLGLALARDGQTAEALPHFKQAAQVDPTSAEFHANQGNALFQLGNIPEAVAQYQESLRYHPDDADIHYRLALALRQAGELPEATAQYNEAMRLKALQAPVPAN